MRLLILFAAIFLTTPVWANWTFQQGGFQAACPGTSATCVINMNSGAIGAGHLLAFSVHSLNGTNFTIISAATGAGTMQLCPASACHNFSASAYNVDAGYVLSTTGGATAVTITLSSTIAGSYNVFVTDYAYTNGPIAFDTAATRNSTVCGLTCAGVALTLAVGRNDVVFQECSGGPNCTGINLNYSTNIQNGAAFSSRGNTSDGTAPTWVLDQTGGTMQFIGMAFKEAAQPLGTKGPLVITF